MAAVGYARAMFAGSSLLAAHCALLIAPRSPPTALLFNNQKSTFNNSFPAYNASVMVAKELLEQLVCPACKQALEYRQTPETLKCTACHRVYPVRDDFPIMLVDEAKIEP
jgi:uncharacterized protein